MSNNGIMDNLTIDPTYRVLLGDVSHFRIMLVGAGGTGSTLALFFGGSRFPRQAEGNPGRLNPC